ncbi:MAG: WD40 repeat domain-containing protein [Gemmataceae bacterium]|nr:WD40 repeat domain-containing protein [Gemmataceae bacterium]
MILLQGAKERVERLFFSPSGNALVVPFTGSVWLWEDVLAGGRPIVFEGERTSSVQSIPSGSRMLFDGPRVSIRDNAGRLEQFLRFAPPLPEAAQAAVSPDGRFLVFAQHEYLDHDKGRLVCRSLDDPATDLWSVPGIHRFPSRPLFLPGGKGFVAMEWWNGESGSDYGPAWMTRDTRTGHVVSESLEQGKGYRELIQSADLSHVVGLSGSHLAIYRIDALVAPVATLRNDSRKILTGAAFHPGGRILAATSNDHTVKFYDTATWGRVGGFDWEVGRLRSVAFSADGCLAAAGSDKGRIVVWDVES